MLHAFNQGKSGLYKRYGCRYHRGHREADEKQVCEEDEITALIMGPLDYLPAEESGAFWQALIGPPTGEGTLLLPPGPVARVHMRFWPRLGVEPDLLVELHWSSGERRLLLVEFKWNAPLSGDDQLHRQWREFLTQPEREEAVHLFIGLDISAALNAVGKENIWGERLIMRSWMNVLDVLHQFKGAPTTGLERWSYQVSTFLKRLKIERFQGFEGLTTPSALPEQTVFWSPLNGFAQLQPPILPSLKAHPPSFIWSSHNE